jgi:hypothetical protein
MEPLASLVLSLAELKALETMTKLYKVRLGRARPSPIRERLVSMEEKVTRSRRSLEHALELINRETEPESSDGKGTS